MIDKPINFKIRLAEIGNNYTAKVIDGEWVGFKKLPNGVEIEVSGLGQRKLKIQTFFIYVWWDKSDDNPCMLSSYSYHSKYYSTKLVKDGVSWQCYTTIDNLKSALKELELKLLGGVDNA